MYAKTVIAQIVDDDNIVKYKSYVPQIIPRIPLWSVINPPYKPQGSYWLVASVLVFISYLNPFKLMQQ